MGAKPGTPAGGANFKVPQVPEMPSAVGTPRTKAKPQTSAPDGWVAPVSKADKTGPKLAAAWLDVQHPEVQNYLKTMPAGTPDPRNYSSQAEWTQARSLHHWNTMADHPETLNPVQERGQKFTPEGGGAGYKIGGPRWDDFKDKHLSMPPLGPDMVDPSDELYHHDRYQDAMSSKHDDDISNVGLDHYSMHREAGEHDSPYDPYLTEGDTKHIDRSTSVGPGISERTHMMKRQPGDPNHGPNRHEAAYPDGAYMRDVPGGKGQSMWDPAAGDWAVEDTASEIGKTDGKGSWNVHTPYGPPGESPQNVSMPVKNQRMMNAPHPSGPRADTLRNPGEHKIPHNWEMDRPGYSAPDVTREESRAPGNPTFASLHPNDRRWVALEGPKFFTANTDALADSHELATRAHNHAAVVTSTFTRHRSAAVCQAFVEKVVELGREAYRPAQRREAATMPDFGDSSLYL